MHIDHAERDFGINQSNVFVKHRAVPIPFRSPVRIPPIETGCRDAEVFYLQKQILSQTPMMIVLEDGEQIEGCIEWWDRNSIKVRGRAKTLIYKSAVKYMYKLTESSR